ncbi:MAG: AMIN domain-containing protein, partial [Jaaginema sp. PMC 1079.18]|nr:AMIN domain-containing protein [Jaaginema sp. PMC 1079.18]
MRPKINVPQKSITPVCQNHRQIRKIALIGAIAPLAIVAPAIAQNDWQYNPNTTELEMVLDSTITPSYYLENNPPRITIDLPDSNIAPTPNPQTYTGVVTNLRVLAENENTRIILYLDPNIPIAPQHIQLQRFDTNPGTYRWVLRPSLVNIATTPVA